MKYFFSSRFHNEKGVTLVMVMMVMIVLSVLGLGILGMAVNNTYLTSAERDYQSAYYIAEAGIVKEFSKIESVVLEYYESSAAPVFFGKVDAEILGKSVLYKDFEQSFGETTSAIVTVTKGEKFSDTSQKYTMSSQGIIGQRKRIVERDITINWQGENSEGGNLKIPANMAVYTNKKIEIAGDIEIDGNAGTNMAGPETIQLTGSVRIENGKVYVPAGSESAAVQMIGKAASLDSEVVGKNSGVMQLPAFPEIPAFPVLGDKLICNDNSKEVELVNNKLIINDKTNECVWNLKDSIHLEEILIDSKAKLVIDTGNSDKAVTVENLNIRSGSIKINGNGSLTIYVKDNFYHKSGSLNDQGDPNKLIMYLKGNNQEINLEQNFTMAGSLYAENANVTLNGNGVFRGNILTGGQSVTIGASSENTMFIFAPNADVILTGNNLIIGSIYSDTFSSNGTSEVVFKEIDYSKIPFGSGSGEEAGSVEMIVTEPITEVSRE